MKLLSFERFGSISEKNRVQFFPTDAEFFLLSELFSSQTVLGKFQRLEKIILDRTLLGVLKSPFEMRSLSVNKEQVFFALKLQKHFCPAKRRPVEPAQSE